MSNNIEGWLGVPVISSSVLERDLLKVRREVLVDDFRRYYYALIGNNIERASRIMKNVIEEDLDVTFAGYMLKDILQHLSNELTGLCTIIKLCRRNENKYLTALCGLKDNWVYKFGSGAGSRVPSAKTMTQAISVFRKVLSDYPQIDAIEIVFSVISKEKRNGNKLKHLGPIILTHWLSLANPKKYIPFDKHACKYFEDRGECKKARGNNWTKFKDYYITFLKEVQNTANKNNIKLVDRRSGVRGVVRDYIELYAALLIADHV